MNNMELVASVAKQASMVEQQITSNINLFNHYITMAQNLRTLSPQALLQALSVYQPQLAAFQSLQKSVGSLQQAAQSTYAMTSGRATEAGALGLDINTYLKNEVALANNKGGAYKQRLDQDFATIQNLADRSSNLQQVSAATAGVTGNLQGIQNLSQISSIAAGELMEVKAALVAQSIDHTADRAQQSQIDAYNAAAATQAAATATARKSRNGGASLNANTPWVGN
jgi:conjugal transfer/entry exclusion protein